MFELSPRLAEHQLQDGGTLSGSEQQMLAIGRALMIRPKLLLLDEPSMGLAPLMVEAIFSIIEQLRSTGATILLVEQNAVQALRLPTGATCWKTAWSHWPTAPISCWAMHTYGPPTWVKEQLDLR